MKITHFSNAHLGYLALRFALGVSFLTHSAVRLPKLTEFATGVEAMFAETIIAGWPALLTGYAVPVVEVVAGLMILLGARYIRWGLVAGIVLMGVLMIGTCVLERWEWLVSQLVHTAVFYLLLLSPHTPDQMVSTK